MLGTDPSDQNQIGGGLPPEISPSQTILDPASYLIQANTAAQFFYNNSNIKDNMTDIMSKVTQSESTIRRYFTVNYKSVTTKITNLAFPFGVKNWSRAVPEDQPQLPIVNPNLPEFYTPMVFLFFFLLLSSVYRGVAGTFSFESISYLFIKTCGILGFLVLLAKLVFFIVNMPNSYSMFQLIADLSVFCFYTAFINLIVCTFSSIRWLCLIYCAIASFFWTIRTLNPKSGIQSVHPSPAHTYSIVVIALLQALAPIVLSESVVSRATIAAKEVAKAAALVSDAAQTTVAAAADAAE